MKYGHLCQRLLQKMPVSRLCRLSSGVLFREFLLRYHRRRRTAGSYLHWNGHSNLSVDYLLQYRFLNPIADVVHLSNPTHHIDCFQALRHALFLRQLFR